MRSLEILVVEDNPVNQKFMSTLLTRKGHSVTIAPTGTAALRHLSEQTPDIVLMDIQLPEMDGITATQHIRKGEMGVLDAQVPIIALSALEERSERIAGPDSGFTAWMRKPIDIPELLELIERTILNR